MTQAKNSNRLNVRIGVWSESEESENSSNWKEFGNAIDAIEHEGREGRLKNAMIFFATDSTTVEGAIDKGNTPSRKLFEHVVKVKRLQIKHGFMLFVVHCSGLRMIAQGTDGVSRGLLNQGSLMGKPLRYYLPLNLTALERCPTLKEWLKRWIPKEHVFLTPEQWCIEGHDVRFRTQQKGHRIMHYERGTYVWTPPAAAADVALEQLLFARSK